MVQFAVRNRRDIKRVKYGIDVQAMKAKYERSALPPLESAREPFCS
jgi:hypothetical protein